MIPVSWPGVCYLSALCWLTAHPPCQDDQLDQYIDRLRFAAMELLMRLSRRFPRKRQGTIFLVTNLTHVVQVSCRAPWRMLSRCSSHGSSLQTISHLLVCGAQRLRDAASQGRQAAHAPGMSPAPPSAPLGAAGAETLQEFQACGTTYHASSLGHVMQWACKAPWAGLRHAVCQHCCAARRTSSRRALAPMWRRPSRSALARSSPLLGQRRRPAKVQGMGAVRPLATWRPLRRPCSGTSLAAGWARSRP